MKRPKVNFIPAESEPEYAVLQIEDYRDLVARSALGDEVRALLARTEGAEDIPLDIVKSLSRGESPVRIWRKRRGMTQIELARASHLSDSYLSKIENGKSDGTLRTLRAIARALGVDLDLLVGPAD